MSKKTPTPQLASTPHDDDYENIVQRATTNLSLLILFAESAGRDEYKGGDPELESESWWAIEHLLTAARNDVKQLGAMLERAESGGAR